MEPIRVYGADWCESTRRTLSHLDGLGIQYDYINVDRDGDASASVKRHNDGKERKPTLDIGGCILTSPSNEQLDEVLRTQRLLA